MEKTYQPQAIEAHWYRRWEQNGYFAPQGDQGKRSYCIALPPPNVTGSLHMGHAFQQTLMDILIRYQRMNGNNTLWQGGTDHAGIATQMVVERQLEAAGKTRQGLGRERFTAAVWDWKEKSGHIISQQSRRLGASMDWRRERFTMDAGCSAAVQQVFIQLYQEGLIYRGKRLVNWDPVLRTAISDLEVIAQEEQGRMWYVRYPRTDGQGHLVIATTRPETMLGDAAVAVHPEDARYHDLIGKRVQLPLTDRTLPVIADDYVDPAFGSGCLKLTPAHDFNDYVVGARHGLALINIFTADAALNEQAPPAYRGLDRQAARQRIVKDLEAAGLLERVEQHRLMVPRGDRSQAVIEPYLTDQWYVRMQPLAAAAIAAVENGDIRFVPAAWSKTYFDWMVNIQDWCISRQLWWGHRIPAWYDAAGKAYVGKDEQAVRRDNRLADSVRLRQDEDVLDTWFSSALWPFSTLGWPQRTPELAAFYPTDVLVTGFDIIFFWVARMIMFGLKFTGRPPFREVYITGLVRDAAGQKMAKSKGNILDPIDLIDGIALEPLVAKQTAGLMQPQLAPMIEQATRRQFPDGIPAFGADALRFTFARLATQGRDIRFATGAIQGYRNFCNKLWNAARFILLQTAARPAADQKNPPDAPGRDAHAGAAERWIVTQLAEALAAAQAALADYRFDLAAQALYEFAWDAYCDWYLELAKVTLSDPDIEEASKQATLRTLAASLEIVLRALHPFIPFITEELWQRIIPLCGRQGETIMLQAYPAADDIAQDAAAARQISWLQEFISALRRIRAEHDIAPGKLLPVQYAGGSRAEISWLQAGDSYIKALGKVSTINRAGPAPVAATALAGEMTVLIPLAQLIDPPAELARLGKQRRKLADTRQRTQAKLDNAGFINGAPEAVIARARARLDETNQAMRRLDAQIERIEQLTSKTSEHRHK